MTQETAQGIGTDVDAMTQESPAGSEGAEIGLTRGKKIVGDAGMTVGPQVVTADEDEGRQRTSHTEHVNARHTWQEKGGKVYHDARGTYEGSTHDA
mmetsp:Transcript_25647/g.35706  ORF Transcript_25647/g.35706 Transcript_25647/m.35706 type:complete len:96 (+) Transcript_25647:473-760(+)